MIHIHLLCIVWVSRTTTTLNKSSWPTNKITTIIRVQHFFYLMYWKTVMWNGLGYHRTIYIIFLMQKPVKYKSRSQISFMPAEYMLSNRSLIWTYIKVSVGTFQTSCNETFSSGKNYVKYKKLSLATSNMIRFTRCENL